MKPTPIIDDKNCPVTLGMLSKVRRGYFRVMVGGICWSVSKSYVDVDCYGDCICYSLGRLGSAHSFDIFKWKGLNVFFISQDTRFSSEYPIQAVLEEYQKLLAKQIVDLQAKAKELEDIK